MQMTIKNRKMSDCLNVLKFDLNSHNLIGTLGIVFHSVYINYRAPHKTGLNKIVREEIKANKDNGNKKNQLRGDRQAWNSDKTQNIKAHCKNASLYNCTLRSGLKDATDLASLSSGRALQTSGASTAKTRSPFVMRRVLGTTCSALPEDPRLRSPS